MLNLNTCKEKMNSAKVHMNSYFYGVFNWGFLYWIAGIKSYINISGAS